MQNCDSMCNTEVVDVFLAASSHSSFAAHQQVWTIAERLSAPHSSGHSGQLALDLARMTSDKSRLLARSWTAVADRYDRCGKGALSQHLLVH